MRNLIFLAAAFLFFGCSLKTDVPMATMYEIHYSNKECSAENKQKELKNVFIENVSALDMVDTRKILIVAENNKIRYLTDAKFVSEPSEMIYKSLVKGLYSNCAAKPNAKDLRLKVSIISLQIRGDKAEVSLAYELFNANTSLKSGMITKEIFCPDPSSSTIFETINKAANSAIDTLISEIIY